MSLHLGPAIPGVGGAEHVTGYRELRLVGRGASSVVYRAVQEAYDRTVALKILTADAGDDVRRRFLDEVRLTARLTGHPHVVTVLDAGMTWSGRPYLAIEFFEDGTLADRLRAHGALPASEVARIGAKAAGALAAAHAAGIVHRDVKPNNILMSGFGEPALADFGVAGLRTTHGGGPEGFTPLHAAPEVLAGARPDAAADIYALGSTLYELLAGRPAFGAVDLGSRATAGPRPGRSGSAPGLQPEVQPTDLGALAAAVAEVDPPPLPGEPELPLAAVIRRAMAKRPGDRWPSAQDFAEALRALAGPPTATTIAELAGTHAPPPPMEPPSPVSQSPSIVIEPADQAARSLWERQSAPQPAQSMAADGFPHLSATMVRADRALAAEPVAVEERRRRGPVVAGIATAALVSAAATYLVTGVGQKPAPVAASSPPPTSAAPPAAGVPAEAMDSSRPSNVVVTPEADKTKVRVDWHIAPGNDHALAVQIQSAFGGSRPQVVMVPALTSSYEVKNLDPSSPGYCFAVGAVVAWGTPSQIAWSTPRCTPGAQVVTQTSSTRA